MKSNHVVNHSAKKATLPAPVSQGCSLQLELNPFAHAALILYAASGKHSTLEAAAMDALRTCVGTITQITEEDFDASFLA